MQATIDTEREMGDLKAWAADLRCVFEWEGEVGFGRECVGILHGSSYVDVPGSGSNYEPEYWEATWGCGHSALWTPETRRADTDYSFAWLGGRETSECPECGHVGRTSERGALCPLHEETPDAYHKHDCLAVLGRGPGPIHQFWLWVERLKKYNPIVVEVRRPMNQDTMHPLALMMHGTTRSMLRIPDVEPIEQEYIW